MDAAMRLFTALALALTLAGCGRPTWHTTAWHMTDISGGSPRLDFHLTRA